MKIWKAILITVLFQLSTTLIDFPLLFSRDYFYNTEGSDLVLATQLFLNFTFYGLWTYYIFKQVHFKYEEEKKVNFDIIFAVIIIFTGFYFFTKPLFYIYQYLKVGNGTFNNYHQKTWADLKNHYSIVYVIGLIIFAPVFEEIFFRRFLFVKLLEKYNFWISIIVSSILFSAIHLPSYNNLLPTFFLGMLSGFIYYKTRKIIYSILLHLLLNASFLYLAYSEFGFKFHSYFSKNAFNSTFWAINLGGCFLLYFGCKVLLKTLEKENLRMAELKNPQEKL